ncbi:MAG: hypothetical protein BGP12_08770 [Rhodospirillales bacterium 70-18]|nr:MAG: hypothetical protein BGP12_08770 [Rhodospirillales bacterium 70-18]
MRRGPRLLLLAVLLLVGGHALLWRWAEQQMEHGLAVQVAQWRSRGWTVAVGTPAWGGWPLHARLTVPDVALSGSGGPPGGVAWTAQRVVLDVALVHPRTLVVDIAGRQSLRLGPGPALAFTAASAEARVPLVPGVPPHSIDLVVAGWQTEPPAARLTAARVSLHLEEQPGAAQGEPAVSAVLDAADITLPPAGAGRTWALGEHIASVAVEAALTGPLSRLPDPQARAEAWRDAGGTVAVRRLALRWGKLDLDGTATLALDEALQPMGTATVRMSGQAETLDALAGAHVLAPAAAQAAKAVLALLARTPPGGGRPEVAVPLALQDRVLTMGRIPLLRLPLLLWPQLVWSTAG